MPFGGRERPKGIACLFSRSEGGWRPPDAHRLRPWAAVSRLSSVHGAASGTARTTRTAREPERKRDGAHNVGFLQKGRQTLISSLRRSTFFYQGGRLLAAFSRRGRKPGL